SGNKLTLFANFKTQTHTRGHVCRSVGIIGAPFSKGQSRGGVERGPDLIRAAGLVQRLQEQGVCVCDYGNLSLEDAAAEEPLGELKSVRAVGSANRRLSDAVQAAKKDGHTSVMLGGDHSLAIGSIHGHTTAVGPLSVVWVDAHADINTPLTTYTGNFHGQPMSFLLHELRSYIPPLPNFSWVKPCVSARDLVYIGLRDVDPAEHHILKLLGVKAFSMSEVDQLGVARVMEETCDYLFPENPAQTVSFPQRLTYREGVYISEYLCQTGLLSGVDLVEVNPLRGQTEEAVQSTVNTAVSVLVSCLGRVREGNPVPLELPPNRLI
uniref:arginase n=1 Tax=Salarias fasciatus TaxID=181472 RepID=A0A672GDM9_SALFA